MGKGFQIVRRKKEAQQKERCLVLRLRYKTTLDTRNEVFPIRKGYAALTMGKVNVSE
jgi:hypothetical protein